MTNNDEMKFDPNCGISEEEQREIFTQINGITEKNRRALAAAADDDGKQDNAPHRKMRHSASPFKAKKSGGLFPILVNAAAVVVLVGGFVVLYGFQGKTDAEVREGVKVYNTAERALIQEIRRDTSAEEDNFARNEMDKLSREQAQSATIEAQMGAFFSNLNNRVNANQFDEAAEIIKSMRSFLDTPSFQSIRSVQTRKEIYTQAINSCEKMVEEARRNPAAIPADSGESEQLLASLQKEKDQLEKTIAAKDKTISDLTSKTPDIAELQGSLDALRTMNRAYEEGSAEKNTQIRDLQRDKATLERTVASNTTTINRIKQVVQVEKSIDDMTFNEIKESLIRIQNALNNN